MAAKWWSSSRIVPCALLSWCSVGRKSCCFSSPMLVWTHGFLFLSACYSFDVKLSQIRPVGDLSSCLLALFGTFLPFFEKVLIFQHKCSNFILLFFLFLPSPGISHFYKVSSGGELCLDSQVWACGMSLPLGLFNRKSKKASALKVTSFTDTSSSRSAWVVLLAFPIPYSYLRPQEEPRLSTSST